MARLTKERRKLFLEPYADWRFSGDTVRGYILCGVSYPGQAEALRHLVKTVVPQLLDDLDAADAEIADDKRLIEGYEGVIVTQRDEIARLTTAFEECDKREREAQEALKAMRDENKALKATLVDYRDYGVRADTNPTIAFEVTPTREGTFRLIGFFYDYLRSIDEHVRERARKALGGDAD